MASLRFLFVALLLLTVANVMTVDGRRRKGLLDRYHKYRILPIIYTVSQSRLEKILSHIVPHSGQSFLNIWSLKIDFTEGLPIFV